MTSIIGNTWTLTVEDADGTSSVDSDDLYNSVDIVVLQLRTDCGHL